MDVIAGRMNEEGHRRPGILVEPVKVVVRRPQRGWLAGPLVAGAMAAAVLVAVVLALAALAGVTAVLWWVGDARIPVLILIYGSVAVAGCGFALGRSGRRLAWWLRLPEGPDELTWPRVGRVQTGLVWEQDDPAIASSAGAGREESCQ